MVEPERASLADNEVPRRSDLNPFRDYPAGSSEGRMATRQSVSGSLPPHLRDLMERRAEFVNVYNSPGISEEVRQTLHAEITRIDQMVEATRQRQEAQRAGLGEAGRGLGCLLLAGAVTLISYLLADPGESYYLLWGGIAVGAFWFVRGLWRVLTDSGRKWLIAIGGLAILGIAWLNPMGLYSTLTDTQESGGVMVPMHGTIQIFSTSCAPSQEVRITPLDARGEQDGKEVSLSVTDDEPVPLVNTGCTITFETVVARAHAYEIAVPGVGAQEVYYSSIEGHAGPPLRVEITL